MSEERFDELTKTFASEQSRRKFGKALTVALAGAAFAIFGLARPNQAEAAQCPNGQPRCAGKCCPNGWNCNSHHICERKSA